MALKEALTAYYESDTRIFFAAREMGITCKQWEAIKSAPPGPTAADTTART